MADERATAAVLAEPICPCGHPVPEHPHHFPGNAYCPDCRRNWVEALLASDWFAAHVAAAIAAVPGDDTARALDEVEAGVFAALRGHTCWHDPTLPEEVRATFAKVRAAHAADEPEAGR